MVTALDGMKCLASPAARPLTLVPPPGPGDEDLGVSVELVQHVFEELRVRVEPTVDQHPLVVAEHHVAFDVTLDHDSGPRLPLIQDRALHSTPPMHPPLLLELEGCSIHAYQISPERALPLVLLIESLDGPRGQRHPNVEFEVLGARLKDIDVGGDHDVVVLYLC